MDDKTYRKMIRRTTTTEWVVEPCDANGEIIDPWHFSRRAQAEAAIPRIFAGLPNAEYVELAKTLRTGSEAEGELEREYTYFTRTYRDGRVEQAPQGYRD